MNEFELYFRLGLDHIADINAYDHILFLVALCATYQLKEWKNVLILVTAFTIGHSITLALATLNILAFQSAIIEMLIPITIMLTALFNIWSERSEALKHSRRISFKYILALLFGFIHGMGFSNYLKELLMGMDSGLAMPLFSFNLGVEVGQIGIVLVILSFSYVAMNILKIKQRLWNGVVSYGTFLLALYLLL